MALGHQNLFLFAFSGLSSWFGFPSTAPVGIIIWIKLPRPIVSGFLVMNFVHVGVLLAMNCKLSVPSSGIESRSEIRRVAVATDGV